MSFSEKIYRVLLRAYPREYRIRYAEPMEQLFRDRLREVHSFAGFLTFWRRTLADWVVSVPARHRERIAPLISFGSLAVPARRCIFFARYEASSFSRREITVEHLLLGILREEPSLVRAGALPSILRSLEANEPAARRVPPSEDLRISFGARRVIESASDIARAAQRNVSPADLAKGILQEKDSLAAHLLRENLRND